MAALRLAMPHPVDRMSANTRRSLADCVAASLDAEPALLPHLPYLLQDLDALGAPVDEVLQALAAAGLQAPARVLDLGCGKGCVARAIAKAIGASVLGVDAVPEFIAEARRRAAHEQLASLCEFRVEDIRLTLDREKEAFDAVVLVAVSKVLGDPVDAARAARRAVRPGGLVLVHDAGLSNAAAPPAGYEGYRPVSEIRAGLTCQGDAVVVEQSSPGEDSHATNRGHYAAISRRAAELDARRPELHDLLKAYLARQLEESAAEGAVVESRTWVIRKAPA